MKRFILLCLCLAGTILSFAVKDIERVSITYEYYSNNPNESPEQAEQTAIEKAKQKALEDKYGVDVSSINSTFISSRLKGEEAQSETNVFSIGGTSVRGEWLETTKEPTIEKRFEKGFWYVKVHIDGKVRSKTEASIEIKAVLVNNAHDRHPREIFYDGDDIFLRFSSPVDGSLCVYLIDEDKEAYCLLPYMNNSVGHQQIKTNEEYLFFSKQTDRDADEYTLNTQRSSESNAVYIVFSPNTFTKASDKQGGQNFRDEQLPRNLSYADFLKWLSKTQIKDSQMVVKTEVITIRK